MTCRVPAGLLEENACVTAGLYLEDREGLGLQGTERHAYFELILDIRMRPHANRFAGHSIRVEERFSCTVAIYQ